VFIGRDPGSGKPVQVQKTFRGTEKDARTAMALLVAEAGDNKSDRGRATVGQLLGRWLEHIGPTRRPSTIAGYRAKIGHALRPAFGHIVLSKLGASDLDAQYRSWLDEGLAAYGAHRSDEVPTSEQLTEMVRVAATYDPVLATAVALAALTGCRRGELCALRWSDIAFDAGAVRVDRAITVVAGEIHIGAVKAHESRRVALDGLGIGILRSRLADMIGLSRDVG
jgi:integrase